MEQPSLINFNHKFSLTVDEWRGSEADSDSEVEEYSGMEQPQLINFTESQVFSYSGRGMRQRGGQ